MPVVTPLDLQQSDAEIVYSEPPWQQAGRGGIMGAVRLFGPGAIIASVSIASGETLFSSRAGALFGYSLLWFILFCAACKLVQVYTAGRYFVLTGEHPMEAWMRLPGPRGWFPIFLGGLSILCFPFWMGGLAGMLGTAMNWMFGLDHGDEAGQYLTAHLFGTGALFVAALLTLRQTYRVLEMFQIVIVGLLMLAILTAIAVADVDWLEALRGTFLAHIPEFDPWVSQKYSDIPAQSTPLLILVIFMGAIGGGSYDYIGYLGLFREKRWGAIAADQPDAAPQTLPGQRRIRLTDDNIRTARNWLRAPIIDIVTGFICVAVFTMAFNILGAAILHPKQEVPAEFALLTPQVKFLTNIHPGLKYLYQVGIFMAFWGTIYGALEIYSRTAYESCRPLFSAVRRARYQKFRLPVCLYAGIGAAVLLWTVKKPMKIVEPAALIGTITCGLWCFAMIWTDRQCLPRPLRMNALWLTLNVLAGAALVIFGVAATIDYLQNWFK